MDKRLDALKYGVTGLILVIMARLFFIQVIQHDYYVAKAEEEHVATRKIKAERGEIYMMDGDQPAAVVLNRAAWTIIVDPMIANPEETEKAISAAVAGDKITAKWEEVFANRELRYFVVAKNVTREEVRKLEEEALGGVWYQEGNARVYPEGEMASQLLGFVNNDGVGQYGVEGALNEELAGEDGLLKSVTDVNNVALSIGDENVKVPAKDGKNVVLTIDRGLQRKIEQEVTKYLDEVRVENGSALVMDPRSGKILAMVTLPTYDPSKYAEVPDAGTYVNVPAEIAYEPASICKTFTFAAAVNEGVMNPQTTYNNQGFLQIDEWKIQNAYKGQLGTITMQTGLNYSLNTSSMTALMLLGGNPTQITAAGREKLYEYYHDRFGLGEATGIELNEATGTVWGPNQGDGDNSRYANMTFGQSLDLSMVQVAAAFSSVVNGGKYYRPTVVAGEILKNGTFSEVTDFSPVREVLSEETSATMREMLYGTRAQWRANGTDPAGYYSGGKTGTAQTIINGAYSFDTTVASYVGFGGTEGELPSYVVMVKVWEDGAKIEGERHALPLFNRLSGLTRDYLEVRPK
ncbi:MAG: penicillin-binding protein 2, partial [Candidatus Saccharibacteria bacterium]|nr:penicillin-binding protein 2 [Candidatus Saccharibacteria bacterium]